MNDLISRSALLKAFENNIDTDVCQEDADYQYLWGFSWETVESAIQAAPAVDAVAVVLCKDCEHWMKDVPGCTDFVGRCDLANYMVGATGYCVYGERRADE